MKCPNSDKIRFSHSSICVHAENNSLFSLKMPGLLTNLTKHINQSCTSHNHSCSFSFQFKWYIKYFKVPRLHYIHWLTLFRCGFIGKIFWFLAQLQNVTLYYERWLNEPNNCNPSIGHSHWIDHYSILEMAKILKANELYPQVTSMN